MSAKAFYQEIPPCIPTLDDVPPEIWSTIIRYAADSGSGLYDYEMTPSEHADFLRGEETAQMGVYHANFRTRSYLARVNKAWYEMAAPFLFEYIHLANAWQIFPLYKALLRSKETAASSGSGCSLGWWTKRLDIHMKKGSRDIQATSLTIAQLAEMVSCFPNLRILTFSASERDYAAMRESFILDAVSCPKTLKVIHWYTQAIWPFATAWTAFLERHPGLQSVRGLRAVKTENQIALHSLEALHTWVPYPLPCGFMELSACNLPNLRCLSCRDNSPPNHQSLHRVGEQLSIFQVNGTLLSDFARDYDVFFSSIRHICFNLVQINFNLFRWRSFLQLYARALFFPRSVKTLGIHFEHDQDSANDLRELLRVAFPLVISNNTSIETIQFLTQTDAESLRRHPKILMEGVEFLFSQGVTVWFCG